MGWLICFSILILVIFCNGLRFYRSSGNITPIFIWSFTLMFYGILAPLTYLIVIGEISVLNIEISNKELFSLYKTLCISSIFLIIGWYSIRKGLRTDFSYLVRGKTIKALTLILLGCMGYFSVHDFTLVNNGKFSETGSLEFSEYLVNTVSFLIIGVSLLLNKESKSTGRLFILSILLTLAIFISSGFRYRILFLLISLLTFAGHYVNYKVGFIRAAFFGSLFLLLFGFIAATRSYSNGLNIERLGRLDSKDFFLTTLFETQVFGYSALVQSTVSNTDYRIGMEPITTAILMPLPRSIFPNKPDAEYLKSLQTSVFGTDKIGMAFLYCIEAYLMFGNFGVALQGFILGFFLRFIWNTARISRYREAFIIVGLVNGLVYWYITRGYLPQVFVSVMFYIVIPLILVKIISVIFRLR